MVRIPFSCKVVKMAMARAAPSVGSVPAFNSSKRQSAINKLFTGKIVYEKNEFWPDEWEIHPKGKGGKLITNRKYTITPFTTSLNKQMEYELEHLSSNVKAQITLL